MRCWNGFVFVLWRAVISFDEVVVLSAGATVVPVGLFIGMIARRLNAAVFHRRDLRAHHD